MKKTSMLSVRVTDEIKNQLQIIASENNVSVGKYIRSLITKE
jgi:antitoxin component of RelBE/YafQ-DinJ toxin-antitoxin module